MMTQYLYSIGMTCYEMLTGIVPFANIKSDFDIRESIIRKDFDKPRSINPTIPLELEMIVMKSINKNPDDRYQTAEDMIQAIENFESQYSLAEGEKKQKKEQQSVPAPVPEDKKPIPDATTQNNIALPKKPILRWVAALIVIALITVIVFNFDFFSSATTPSKSISEDRSLSHITISSTPANASIIIKIKM